MIWLRSIVEEQVLHLPGRPDAVWGYTDKGFIHFPSIGIAFSLTGLAAFSITAAACLSASILQSWMPGPERVICSEPVYKVLPPHKVRGTVDSPWLYDRLP